jgi:hypothetical protein
MIKNGEKIQSCVNSIPDTNFMQAMPGWIQLLVQSLILLNQLPHFPLAPPQLSLLPLQLLSQPHLPLILLHD